MRKACVGTLAYFNAARRLDSRIEDWMDSVSRTQPDDKKRQLHRIQIGDVEPCLTMKNDRRFTLSRSEEKALRKPPRGSEQRHRFVYALSRDRTGCDTPARAHPNKGAAVTFAGIRG